MNTWAPKLKIHPVSFINSPKILKYNPNDTCIGHTCGKLHNTAEGIQRSKTRRDILHPWISRLNLVKTSILPTIAYQFNPIPLKIPAIFFVDTENSILKFI